MIPIAPLFALLKGADWIRIAVYASLALAIVGLIWGHGYHKGSQRLFDYQVQQAQEAVKVVVKQGEVTERVVTRYVKVKGDTQDVTRTIEKEVVRYAANNSSYCLDADWGRLHDGAALNAVPQAAGPPDGPRGAPTAAGALEAVTESYAACHRTADRLDALQHWVREQHRVTQP